MQACSKDGVTDLRVQQSVCRRTCGRPVPPLTSTFSSDTSQPGKTLVFGDADKLSQTLTNPSKLPPSFHRHQKRPVRACVCACARALAQATGMPLLPSESSSFPACSGPAKWAGETQDGGSHEFRLQPPTVRLPDLVSGEETRAAVGWAGLGWPGGSFRTAGRTV